MITASSYTFFIAKGRYPKRVHSVGLLFVSARTNQRPWHHHRVCKCVCVCVYICMWFRLGERLFIGAQLSNLYTATALACPLDRCKGRASSPVTLSRMRCDMQGGVAAVGLHATAVLFCSRLHTRHDEPNAGNVWRSDA
jgi:hypothetical protein